MAQVWLLSLLAMSTDSSDQIQPVTAHGKFLSRADSKFFLKAMRLDRAPADHNFTAKIELRSRLAQLKTAHTTTIIVNSADADQVIDLGASMGLYTVIEIDFAAEPLLRRSGVKAIRAELERVARRFAGRAGLIGF